MNHMYHETFIWSLRTISYTDESETIKNSLHQNIIISNTVKNNRRKLKNEKQKNNI